MNFGTDITWAVPMFLLFAAAFLVLDVQILVVSWCVRKRKRGLRAASWLEVIAGYSGEQRKKSNP